MTTHTNSRTGAIHHDSDTIKDVLVERGFTANQAEAAIMNHVFSDSFSSDRQWRRNYYVLTTENKTITGDKLTKVLHEIMHYGIPTTYRQTGTPIKP